MFSTPDHGLIVHDYSTTDPTNVLLGIDVPYYYFMKSTSDGVDVTAENKGQVVRKTMRDFSGLEDADANVKAAMMNFCFLSSVGNMDEAFKSIKSIKRFVL